MMSFSSLVPHVSQRDIRGPYHCGIQELSSNLKCCIIVGRGDLMPGILVFFLRDRDNKAMDTKNGRWVLVIIM